MTPEKEQISSPSPVLIFIVGILFVVFSGALLALGGFSGIREKMNPLFELMKTQAEQNPVKRETQGTPQYVDGKNYADPKNREDIEVEEKAPEYGGVKLDMKQQQQEDEKIDSISEYPIPTLHPWEPGGKDWQDEYWDNP
jgi:hypothetical protein